MARALVEVVADRLLDDQPRERLAIGRTDEPRARQLLDRRHEHRRRHRQVVDAIARQAAFVLDDVEARAERRERAARPSIER